ncbi:MAG: hypothetical protein GF403_07495 [Candidatus Coatesbacteria bacterium]|nr:hypothetical protein [Candidatus Coatesbacteria bacterium]
MGIQYKNLDDVTREKMLEEVKRDIYNGCLYIGTSVKHTAKQQYENLLIESVKHHNDDWLADEILRRGLLLAYEPKSGNKVAKNAHKRLAQGEFNRFYIRGLCVRAIEEGISQVFVYRGRASSRSRPKSESLIGSPLDPSVLLRDLRNSIGREPAFLPDVNSGISVALP